jgi:3-phenylpropionate/trans-cinnamate dioxygenase ferredoxin subunit
VCFDLRTGQPDGPFTSEPVRTHRVAVIDGQVYLQLSEEPGATPHVDAEVA